MRDDRRERGSFYTPAPVADLALALADVTPGRRCRVLDPTCGDGGFLERARSRAPAELVGVEIDETAARSAAARVPAAEIRCADLFSLPAEIVGEADAVVGNPPYVRQERLGPAAKARVRSRLKADFPDAPEDVFDRLTGRGDLAVACAARCLRLARPGGRVALVLSSALLDAEYARPLWELAARRGRVDAILDAPGERWFSDAAVNAVIVAFEIGESARRRRAPVVAARLREGTEEAAREARAREDLERVASAREVDAARPEAWAAALRGSALYGAFEAALGDALVPLGSLARVRRGLTTGANDVFYLSRQRAAELEIEPAVLAPLLRAPPRGGPAPIAVDPDATAHVVFAPSPELTAGDWAQIPNAARYLAECADAAERPTLRGRRPWWALRRAPARLFLTKAYAARFVQQFSPRPVFADQRVYAVHPREGVDERLLAAVLNSTFTALALESLGRASMGEGALEWTVSGAARLPVIDPRRLCGESAKRAFRALSALARRPVGEVALERDRPDRCELDAALAADHPEIARMVPAIHDALETSVAARAARAKAGKRAASLRAG